MAQYPKIKFIVDYKKDIGNCLNFLSWHRKDTKLDYNRKFLPGFMHFVLEPDFSIKERKKIINGFTKSYYDSHQQKITANVRQIEKSWLKAASRYYKLMDKIFKGHPWPKGNYRGIASIYNMFPRYIKYKIFFFPPEHPIKNYATKVIAHEMTHFIFFDYLQKKYKLNENSKIKGKSDNYVWLVSEIFNFTLENWKPYTGIMKNELRRQPYFGELKLCQKMRRDWQKKQDMDWLIDKWLK